MGGDETIAGAIHDGAGSLVPAVREEKRMHVEDTTIEWFGTATFRVRHGGLELFFDAYLDRLPGLVPVGISTAQVESADFVFVSHAHFEHLYGADAIAVRTGATVVASPESARIRPERVVRTGALFDLLQSAQGPV